MVAVLQGGKTLGAERIKAGMTRPRHDGVIGKRSYID